LKNVCLPAFILHTMGLCLIFRMNVGENGNNHIREILLGDACSFPLKTDGDGLTRFTIVFK